jgi:hypothetical protein
METNTQTQLYKRCMIGIKVSKSRFVNIMYYINENNEIKKELTKKIIDHLNQLYQMWINNEDANIEYYFKMKEHHSHINGKIKNKTLSKMWDDYIRSCLKFRIDLMRFNHIMCNQ